MNIDHLSFEISNHFEQNFKWHMFRYWLLIFIIIVEPVSCNPQIPLGLIFSAKNHDVYVRYNRYARQYALKKLSDQVQYNFTERLDQFHEDDIDIDIWSRLCEMISAGVVTIIGDAITHESHWLIDFATVHRVPWLSLSPSNYQSQAFSIALMPDVLPALVAFIRRYQIPQLVYIYDDTHGAQRLKQLVQIQTSTNGFNLNLISRYLDHPDDVYDLLENVETTTNLPIRSSSSTSSSSIRQGRYIVLDFRSIDTYRVAMDAIKHRGMTRTEFHYILLTLDAKQLDMTYFRYGGVNVTFFSLPALDYEQSTALTRLYFDKNSSTIDFFLLADAWQTIIRSLFHSQNLNKDVDDVQIKAGVNNSLVFNECTSTTTYQLDHEQLYKSMLDARFSGFTGNIQFSNETGRRINYTFDIYRVTRNQLPKHIGHFREPSTFQIADEPINFFQKKLDNRTRLIVTIFDEPFMMLKKHVNESLSEKNIPRGTILDPSLVEGFCVDLAYAICHEKLKIPYKFLIETKYGNEIDKGVWNGMVGALVNREADLSIASLTINGAREKAVDFSKPFIDLGISIMIRKPEKQKPGVFSFMDPLSKEIWICVILSYLLVSGILFFVSRFSSYEWYFENQTDLEPKNKFSLDNSLFFSFAAFMHQGVDLLPRSISGRVVTSAWWFFSLILVSSYTANLAAFLTVEKLVTPIETVEDLAKQTEIRYGTLKGGSTMAFFNKSTLTTFKRMWNFMQQHADDVFVASNRDGIEKVRRSKGKFAFLLESTLNEYVNERLPCDTMRIGENIDAKGYGIATPLGSDLRETINIAVLELTESGFLERLKQKWYYERSECTSSGAKDSKQSTALNLANVAGMFYVLIFGLGSAMVIAFLEFLFKAKIDSKRSNLNIRDVMRRNLRISITGIDFDEKLQTIDYWPLHQHLATLDDKRNAQRMERLSALSNAFENGRYHEEEQLHRNYRFKHMSPV